MVSLPQIIKQNLNDFRAYEIALFALGYANSFRFLTPIGQLYFSEIYLITCGIPLFRFYTKTPIFKKIAFIFVLCVCTHVIPEIIHSTPSIHLFKRGCLFLFSFLHITFLYHRITSAPHIIVVYLVANAFRYIWLDYGYVDLDIEDMSMAYLKFHLVFGVFYAMSAIYILFGLNINTTIIGCTLGVIMLMAGSRSAGFILSTAPLIALYLSKNTISISPKRILKSIVTASIFFYILFAIFVTLSLNGTLNKGNTAQVFSLKNPYNIIEYYTKGRSDNAKAIEIGCDNPLIGIGMDAIDKDLKYSTTENGKLSRSAIKNEKSGKETKIPLHSYLWGAFAESGILALLAYFYLLLYMFRLSIKYINHIDNRLRYIFAYSIIMISFELITAPPGNLRYLISSLLALFLFCCFISERQVTQHLSQTNSHPQPNVAP